MKVRVLLVVLEKGEGGAYIRKESFGFYLVLKGDLERGGGGGGGEEGGRRLIKGMKVIVLLVFLERRGGGAYKGKDSFGCYFSFEGGLIRGVGGVEAYKGNVSSGFTSIFGKGGVLITARKAFVFISFDGLIKRGGGSYHSISQFS